MVQQSRDFGVWQAQYLILAHALRAGTFDPSLMFVMGAALLVSLPLTQLSIKHLKRPLSTPSFCLPTNTSVDWSLVGGAALFGAGWGLGGICPGPAVVSVLSLQPKVVAFIMAMLAGTRLQTVLASKEEKKMK